MYKEIELNDKEIAKAINSELKRQQLHIELIASENYVSEDVLKATGSVLTNKYGEGYPKRRYYGSCENVDRVESLAIARAQELFKVNYVNVQPYSGSVANAAALATLAPLGGKVFGLELSSGGHLTHGFKISFSGIFYDAHTYTVAENGFLDYQKILEAAQRIKPDVIIAGYTAYSRVVDFQKFRAIADSVGAKLLADISHISGFVITGLHPSPIPYAHLTMTTTHKTLRGARGAILMTNDSEIAKKMNRWVFPGYQGGPLFHSIAGKAVAFLEAQQPFYHQYIAQVQKNAQAFAQAFLDKKVEIVTGGTDNHLFTINVKNSYQITGKKAEETLEKVNITTNKNTVPFDTESPFIGSGLRLGSPAMTSRNLKVKDFQKIADFIDRALKNHDSEIYLANLKNEVLAFVKQFPIIKNFYLGQ